MTWLKDQNGNRCSVEYFGTKEAAQKALDSLKDCDNCTNCSLCSGCSGCSRCSRCSRCSYCSYCSGCSDCSGCKGKKGDSTKEPTFKVIPAIKNLHKKLYKAVSDPTHLKMSTWHTCETTHCRAGWVVKLAGDNGKKLEKFFNTELAAMLIYRESGYEINPARFYDSDEDALADIKKLAQGKSKLSREGQ